MFKLRRIFSLIVPRGGKQKELEELRDWLDDTVEAIRKKYAEPVDEKGDFRCGTYGIDVDGSQFSKQQLAPVAKKIAELHDFCREKNIRLEIAGFDLMPHGHSVVRGGASAPYSVQIGLDAGWTYCDYDHPQSLRLWAKDERMEMSSQKQLPGPDAAQNPPVEEAPPTREITVYSPLRLQPKPPG